MLTSTWKLLRLTIGWLLIVIGLIGMPLPIVNGLIFLVMGIALVGQRNYLIRWSRVQIKRLLRWWAALPHPLLGPPGRLAHRSAVEVSRRSRRLHWWYAARQRGTALSAGSTSGTADAD